MIQSKSFVRYVSVNLTVSIIGKSKKINDATDIRL